MHRFRLFSAVLLALLLVLAACGDRKPVDDEASAAESLPRPQATGGSATGMPAPGPSTPDPGRIEDSEPAPAAETDGIAQPATDASVQNESGASAEAAVAVLRDYYAALNAHDFARAHALWRQNPQTLAQFTNGFAGTAGMSVEIGAPGPIDAGAGQRFIEIPVKLDATQQDGRVDRYAGRYVLHRSVVEGGNPDWRIERATLAKQ